MKIVVRTPTELIIRDSAATLRWFGAFLVAFGAIVIWVGVTQDPDGRVAAVPTIIGCVLSLGGVLMLALPSTKTFAFSKSERVFIIARESFGRVQRQMIPLADVADVALDESRSDDGSTYRVVVTLADQRRVPWTSYYTSGYAANRAAVELVRDFLGFDPSLATASDLASGGAATRERAARGERVGLTVMGLFCALFLGVGITMLAKEQRRLSFYAPVTVTVLSTRVEERSDSDGSTYEPVVVYRYRVNDREYTASRVTPLKESRSGRWAYRVANRYQVGGEYTAFYDPEKPAEAFLMRTRSILPWAFLGIPLVGFLFIVAAIRGSRDASRMSR